MRNKQARHSAIDTYANIYLSADLNSPKFHWSFGRLRNAELGFRRSVHFMRSPGFSAVSIKAEDLK